MADLEHAITGYFPQIYAGVYQGYRVILRAMLTALYIEALLVDEYLADQVWKLWNAGLIEGVVVADCERLLTAQSGHGRPH